MSAVVEWQASSGTAVFAAVAVFVAGGAFASFHYAVVPSIAAFASFPQPALLASQAPFLLFYFPFRIRWICSVWVVCGLLLR